MQHENTKSCSRWYDALSQRILVAFAAACCLNSLHFGLLFMANGSPCLSAMDVQVYLQHSVGIIAKP